MNSNSLFRTVLPLLAFVAAFTGTAGLTLSAADSKAQSKQKKDPTAEKKPAATAAAKSDEDRPPLKIGVDSKSINRDGYDRVSYAPIVRKIAEGAEHLYRDGSVPDRVPRAVDDGEAALGRLPAQRDHLRAQLTGRRV